MKNFFLILITFLITFLGYYVVNANTLSSNITNITFKKECVKRGGFLNTLCFEYKTSPDRILNGWTENSNISECESKNLERTIFGEKKMVTHYGVPKINIYRAPRTGNGINSCIINTYSGEKYVKRVGNNGITTCASGERVVDYTYKELKFVEKEPYQVIEDVCTYERKISGPKKGVFGIKYGNKYTYEYKCESIPNIKYRNKIVNLKQVDTITCEKPDNDNNIPGFYPILSSEIKIPGINNIYVRATDSYKIDLKFNINKTGNNSADIKLVKSKIELPDGTYAQIDAMKGDSIEGSPKILNNIYTIEGVDFSIVDDKDNLKLRTTAEKAGNYRSYKFILEDVCDEGYNCLSATPGKVPITYEYRVYADYIDASKTSKFIENNSVADGTEKKFTFDLKDKYGNKILPVINGTRVIRSLNFETKYKNNVYLNQYDETGNGIVGSDFYNGDNSPSIYDKFKMNLDKFTYNFANNSFKSSKYGFSLKPYSPTTSLKDGGQYLDYSSSIEGITVKLSDKATHDNLLGKRVLNYKPLYYTSMEGGIIDQGMVIGARQDTNLKLTKNTPSTDATNKNILLEYGVGKEHKEHDNFKLSYNKDKSENFNNIVSGKQENSNNLTNFGGKIGNNNISTNLEQVGKIQNYNEKTYLATFIKNTFPGKIVSVYPSFVHGLTKYNGELEDKNTFQKPLKIIGSTHSQNQSKVSDEVTEDELRLLGNLDKAELQKTIRKKIFDDTRNLKFKDSGLLKITGFNSTNIGRGVLVGDTVYYKSNGDKVEININNDYSGIKNIVILGGDAYITGNLTAKDKKKDIISIIAVTENNKGGNIFIKPDVKRLNAVLYADKVVASSNNGTTILSPKNGGTYEILKNQLYIYGSVFSNNTIGGSINSEPICPYFINKASCTIDEAQKYDLYNLRRGFEDKTYNEDYAVVIEYNPLIQTAKIPFFQIKK